MALTATVTKKNVTTIQPKLFSIVFNLVIKDANVEVINRDFSCEYHTGDDPASKVAEVKEKMQIVIDSYKAEKVIYNAAALNTAVTNIEGGLVL
jgi:hypothetical protein